MTDPSNWAQATAVPFLVRPPVTAIWHPGNGTRPDRYWLDDVPVSEAVFHLATGRQNLVAARALWLRETA
jgi:hypothetical protein